MSTQDTTLPPPCGWPTMLELFIEASATLIRQAQAAECNEHNYEQLLSAVQRVTDYGQQGLSALTKQARAAIAAQAQQSSSTEALRKMLEAANESDSSRWEIGFRNIVAILYGPKHKFEIADVVERVRQQAQGVPASLDLSDLQDRLVAVSKAVADQDDRAAQAMLAETLKLLAAAPQAEPQTPAVGAARDSDKRLMEFYSVESVPALIDAQEAHILRLQAKLPPINQPAFTRVREG